MKKRKILIGALSVVLIAVLIWCALPKETLSSFTGGKLTTVGIKAYNPDRTSPPMYRSVSFTEGELFDQFAYFFYHKAVTIEPLDFEDMVYTETEYPIVYYLLLETVEGGICRIRIDPYENGTAEIDMYHEEEYRILDRAYRIQLPLGMPFDSKVNHQYAWSEGKHPSELQ